MGDLSPYEVLTGLRGRLPRRYLERDGVTRRAAIIVLDGVGIGAAPDAAHYGDVGSNTLGNLARAVGGMELPNLRRVGLGQHRAARRRRADRRRRRARGD